MAGIKAIIFDLGGVYLNQGLRIAISGKFTKMFDLEIPAENDGTASVFWRNIYSSGFMSGKISEKEYWRLCGKELDADIDRKIVREIILSSFEEQEEVVDLIRKLEGDYLLGLLSDMPSGWMDWLEDKFRIFRNFNTVVVSGFEGMEKPNPEIYQVMLERINCEPTECVFIDDFPKNLEYPKKIGMKTILYKDHRRLESELRKLGVEI